MACVICDHPHVKEIETVTSTISLREASRQYKVSTASVSRHMKHLREAGETKLVPINPPAVTRMGLTQKQKQFLEQYALLGTIDMATRAIGVAKSSHNTWLRSSPMYEREWAEAKESYNDKIRHKFNEILELPASEHLKHPVALLAIARSRMPEFADPVANVVNVNVAFLPDANETQVRNFIGQRKPHPNDDVVDGELVE